MDNPHSQLRAAGIGLHEEAGYHGRSASDSISCRVPVVVTFPPAPLRRALTGSRPASASPFHLVAALLIMDNSCPPAAPSSSRFRMVACRRLFLASCALVFFVDQSAHAQPTEPTYWQDVRPIFRK